MATPETNPRYKLMRGNNPKVVEQQNKYLYFFGFEHQSDLYNWEMTMNLDCFDDKTLEKLYIKLLENSIENNKRTDAEIIDKIVFDTPVGVDT